MTDYRTLFDDIVSEIGDAGDRDAEMIAMLEAFEQSILGWLVYHEDSAKKYKELHRRFLTQDYKK